MVCGLDMRGLYLCFYKLVGIVWGYLRLKVENRVCSCDGGDWGIFLGLEYFVVLVRGLSFWVKGMKFM